MQSEKAASLAAILGAMPSVTIAVSGGVDSLTLAVFAGRQLGPNRVTIMHAVSPAVPPDATARVVHFAKLENWRLRQIDAGEFHDESIDAMALLPDAIEQHGVAYVPGSAFSVTGGAQNTVRLNFSACTPEQIAEGVARLRAVLT